MRASVAQTFNHRVEKERMRVTGQGWHDIISGARQDLTARLGRIGLHPLSWLYGIAVTCYHSAYDRHALSSYRAPFPVISVGNLTAGGTGKTPFCVWLMKTLRAAQRQPILLSRGYRATRQPHIPSRMNDEAQLLAFYCPEMKHYQHRQRAMIMRQLLPECPPHTVFVLDDGFQHRRVARDLDIVLIDATLPWGYGHLLPRGLLREPRTALRRADLVLITRADQIPQRQLDQLATEIQRWRGRPHDGTLTFRPTRLVNSAGVTAPLDTLAQHPWGAFCGIGNPTGFLRTLHALNLNPPLQTFPDHHLYTQRDWDLLSRWQRQLAVPGLLTTMKDLVKVPRHLHHIWAIDGEITWLEGADVFVHILERALHPFETRTYRGVA
ncbi:MAG: tetraacyldisaccharide 4'-kinase [Planctomycetaceae bacterium]|nr:MAG: tetraacyldisaccharide 4'-kinase [Planctomycetaceae bacterium]